jgi:hypothetical protein
LKYQLSSPVVNSQRFAARLVTEIAVVLAGIALLGAALAANHQWLDRHFLPSFVFSRHLFVMMASLVRLVTAALGATLALILRPRIGRLVARVPPRRLMADVGSVLLAVAMALGTSELVLRHTFGDAAEERPPDEEPLRHRDPRLGWLFVPARTGHEKIGGRVVEYTFDPAGYRVRDANAVVDPDRPTIIFTGESSMVGYGLTWQESVPAQVGAILGTQCANIAVNGYATDQAYLRLVAELPRFRQPIAVVSLFMPTLFDRNLDTDRPHLDWSSVDWSNPDGPKFDGSQVEPGLVWRPGVFQWRLAAIRDIMFPYRSSEAIERGVIVTREVLLATVALARSRGALPIILVPEFTPEDPTERVLRREILDDAGLPYLLVKLDPSWHVRGDSHPDARAAHAMAVAIAARLREPR